MASPAKRAKNKEVEQTNFAWRAINKSGKSVKGEQYALSSVLVASKLRKQGYREIHVKKASSRRGKTVTEKDIVIFTRQVSTMLKSGTPIASGLQLVEQSSGNPTLSKMIGKIRNDVKSGETLADSFRKFPLYFDDLYCNLIAAGEKSGQLETVFDQLATYREKVMGIKSKIKGALFYPITVLFVAAIVVTIIMIFVIPQFKEVFQSFGADLPAPTLVVIAMSEFMTKHGFLLAIIIGGGIYTFLHTWKRSKPMQITMDKKLLQLPVFGDLIQKGALARWSRTLSTLSKAGVPLSEALQSVAGAAGNYVYQQATEEIRKDVTSGSNLTTAMETTHVFPKMMLQMINIGAESGRIDTMLTKVADFYEEEVDQTVDNLQSIMQPLIMVILGGIIGSIVIAMYMPIFKIGAVV